MLRGHMKCCPSAVNIFLLKGHTIPYLARNVWYLVRNMWLPSRCTSHSPSAPYLDPPPISFTKLSKKKKKKCYVTHDMWHVTCDTWHVTHDTWHVTRWGGWTFSQNFSSLALTVFLFMILWRYGGKGSLTYRMNELIRDEAVYRTALATPGLLNIYNYWQTRCSRGCPTNSLVINWVTDPFPKISS